MRNLMYERIDSEANRFSVFLSTHRGTLTSHLISLTHPVRRPTTFTPFPSLSNQSVYKIHAKKMQYQAPEHEIRKRPTTPHHQHSSPIGEYEERRLYRSGLTLLNSALFSGFVWMRKLAVRTNWPTVALKPARKALKGWIWGKGG